MLLHAMEEFHNHFGARTNEHLPFASLFGVVDGVERIIQNAGFDHDEGFARFLALCQGLRYLSSRWRCRSAEVLRESLWFCKIRSPGS